MRRLSFLLLAPFVVLALAGPATAQLRRSLAARHAALDTSIHGGRGYSDSDDSATLAWAESYVLASYLARFEATGERRFLDALVAHVDRILANASDHDGDGYLGWGTARYSADELPNGGFEEAHCKLRLGSLCLQRDPSLPEHWTRWQSTAATATRTKVAKRSGSYGVRLRTAPPYWQVLECRPWKAGSFRYDPGRWYRLTFAARTNGKVGAHVQVRDFTAAGTLAARVVGGTNWTVHTLDFRAPAAGHDVAVRLMPADPKVAGGEVWFDDLKLQQKLEWLVHDGMITWPIAHFVAVVRRDPALAAYRGKADAYLAFLTRQVLPKWEPHYRSLLGNTAGVYVFPPDPSYPWHGNSLPHNQYLALGRTYLWLYRATGNPAHALRARRLGTWFLRNLRPNPKSSAAYTWRYFDPIPGDRQQASGPEDTSHANIDVGFAVLAARRGVLFGDAHLARFGATLTSVMWNRSWDRPRLAKNVEGGGDDGYSLYLSSWAQLARRLTATRPAHMHDLVRAVHDDLRSGHVPTRMLVAAELLASLPVRNGSFERADLDDPSLPAGWRRWQASAATASLGTGLDGRGAAVLTDGKRWQVLEQVVSPYPPATPGTLSAWARGDGRVRARVQLYDATTRRVLAERFVSGSRWQPVCMSFVTPNRDDHDLRVRLYHDDWRPLGAQARFDDVSLEFSPIHDGDFEAPSAVDATLPAGWRRWQSRAATAHRCVGCGTRGGAGVRLVTDPARGWQVLEQRLSGYRAGVRHTVAFDAKVSTTVGAVASVVDFSSSPAKTLGSAIVTSKSWKRASFSFTAPATLDRDVRLRLRPARWNVAGASVWFDDVTITPFGCSPCPPRNVEYGTGKPGSLGTPRLSSSTPPALGATWRLDLAKALPGAAAYVLAGAEDLAVPFDGGTLLVRPDVALSLTVSRTGTARLSLGVPNDRSLCGGEVFWQAWIPGDPRAAGAGWAASNGLLMRVGR